MRVFEDPEQYVHNYIITYGMSLSAKSILQLILWLKIFTLLTLKKLDYVWTSA